MKKLIAVAFSVACLLLVQACVTSPQSSSDPRESAGRGPASEHATRIARDDRMVGNAPMLPAVQGIPPPVARRPDANSRDIRQIRAAKIYFATDRVPSGPGSQSKFFSSEASDAANPLTYGVTVVTIPKIHREGALEEPAWWKFEFKEDPERHIVVNQPRTFAEKEFFEKLRAEVKGRDQKEVLIFVHGFNNSFDAASKRLAQVAYDLGFNGTPMLYSWASAGGVADYVHDKEAAENTGRWLAYFLEQTVAHARAAGAKRVNILAHSMGNRALAAALQVLRPKMKSGPLFDAIVMAAPDVAAKRFIQDKWSDFDKAATLKTLYASAADKALASSWKLQSYPRIGQLQPTPLLVEGLDTIDASDVDFSLLSLGHSYFATPSVVTDLRALLFAGKRASDRKLERRTPATRPPLFWLKAPAP